MLRGFSDQLRDDTHCRVQEALRINGIVDIIGLSEEIRLKNIAENIAREDIESLVLEISQLYGAPIEFDDDARTALDMPRDLGRDNRNDLEKMLDGRTGCGDITGDLLQ
ncbi:hypothetical protein MPL1032_250038 [Mesorhizobium plurifarium]|uniref:Uncharacterized protein n=1 Tax=Mesorhizobium plurifarium TaxID=69974 RepID=A0A0K2W1S0_MESPL|nr:hypothetical protein MPL1032_250038 [Mesorhizobium plurifarium]